MIISNKSHNKVFNSQKRLLKRKIWFAVFRYKNSITINKDKNLLPDTIKWLKSEGLKVRYIPSMHIPHIGGMLGFWIIEW